MEKKPFNIVYSNTGRTGEDDLSVFPCYAINKTEAEALFKAFARNAAIVRTIEGDDKREVAIALTLTFGPDRELV